MEIIGIIIVAILVNNVVFSQFLGICPFMGVSKKLDTAIGMGAAVTFVLTRHVGFVSDSERHLEPFWP
jgi:electron transport complex protein RnfA